MEEASSFDVNITGVEGHVIGKFGSTKTCIQTAYSVLVHILAVNDVHGAPMTIARIKKKEAGHSDLEGAKHKIEDIAMKARKNEAKKMATNVETSKKKETNPNREKK